MADPSPSILSQAELLRDLADTLIPGDESWPAAGLIGVQAQLCARLLVRDGETGVPTLVRALCDCGAPFAGRTVEEREAIVARFEAAEPKLFAFVRDASYFAYYDSPLVVAAVQSLGQPYRAIPVLEGYPAPPFDRDRDAPRHGRGFYVATNDVKRVDLSGLPHLKPLPSP